MEQVLIPRADIIKAREKGLEAVRDGVEFSGVDIRTYEKFHKLVTKLPINERLTPIGVNVYFLTIIETVKKEMPDEPIVQWFLVPISIELERLPGVKDAREGLLKQR